MNDRAVAGVSVRRGRGRWCRGDGCGRGRCGAAATAGAAAGAGDGAGAAAPAAADVSTSARTSPCWTLSPTRTLTSRMRPATVAGLPSSLSRIRVRLSGASTAIVSPVLMKTLMIGTLVNPPMSGTTNSVTVAGRCRGGRLRRAGAAAARGGCGCGGRRSWGRGAGAGAAAASAVSTLTSTEPSLHLVADLHLDRLSRRRRASTELPSSLYPTRARRAANLFRSCRRARRAPRSTGTSVKPPISGTLISD